MHFLELSKQTYGRYQRHKFCRRLMLREPCSILYALPDFIIKKRHMLETKLTFLRWISGALCIADCAASIAMVRYRTLDHKMQFCRRIRKAAAKPPLRFLSMTGCVPSFRYARLWWLFKLVSMLSIILFFW